MPKHNNRKILRNRIKNLNPRIAQVPQQDPEEQPNTMEYNNTHENIIPPRLLRKLRRIPRLAELERMFDEPTSSEDSSLLPPASPQNPTPKANEAVAGSSSLTDCLPSTSGSPPAGPTIPHPSQTNGDIDCVVVDTTNSSNLIDLTGDEDNEYIVNQQNKSTNTLITLGSFTNSVNNHHGNNVSLSMNYRPVPSTASLREESNDHLILVELPTIRNSVSEPQAESENFVSVGTQTANKNECRTTNKRLMKECPVCLDKLRCSDLASTLCGHVFCLQCIKEVVQSGNKKCPSCRKPLSNKSYHALYL